MNPTLLLHGHDTIECAYYLVALPGCTLDFAKLAVEKEALRLSKVCRPKAITLGSEEFLLMPMDTLDELIVDQLADQVSTPERLNLLISDLRKRTKNTKDAEQQKINLLNKQLIKSEQAQRNLLTAIENGLPFDEILQKRSQELKAERESLLVELAGIRRSVAVPVDRILPSNIDAFSKAVRAKLKDKAFAMRYL